MVAATGPGGPILGGPVVARQVSPFFTGLAVFD